MHSKEQCEKKNIINKSNDILDHSDKNKKMKQ